MESSTFTNFMIVVLLASAGFFIWNWFQSKKNSSSPSNYNLNNRTQKELQDLETTASEAQPNEAPQPAQPSYAEAQLKQASLDLAEDGTGSSVSRFGNELSAALSRKYNRLRHWSFSWGESVFILALSLYLVIRLIGLSEYPIFFFTDEAVQTNLAADFIRDGLKNQEGEFLPTYFRNVDRLNLSITVYAQVIPYLLFGKSVFVTRAVSVLFSLFGAYWVGLTLRDIFKIRLWWSGVLLLSIAPAWFLHSRTAFETVMMASFYAGFLYYYLSYRYLDPKKLYWALSLGALAFYTYSPGRVVVVLTGLLFLLSDFRYHLKHKDIALRGLGVLGLLILPYLRFQIAHSSASFDQLRLMGSYWLQSIPITEKLARFWSEYLFGLNPGYWFFDSTRDFNRHLMGDYGHLLPITIPLGIVGFLVAVKSFRSSSAHRAILIAIIAAPTGAALVSIVISRILVYVIPAILIISLGLETIVNWLKGRGLNHQFLSYGIFILLAAANISITRDALVNGPFWSSNYGLGGMQYGASQLYGAVQEYIDENPSAKIRITPNWANGPGVLADFFFPEGRKFALGTIHDYLYWQIPLNDQMMFVAIPSEYDLIVESGKFKDITIEKTINYPDGNPGFYFLTLSYVDNIETIFADEYDERTPPIEDVINFNGEEVPVKHAMLDIGEIRHLFDGDKLTVTRSVEANPYVVELAFPEPRTISGLSVVTGTEYIRLDIFLTPSGGNDNKITYSYTYLGSYDQTEFHFSFPETHLIEEVRLEFWDLRWEMPPYIHVWEIIFEE